MDNLTHSLVGLTAAKAGLDKLSPGATTLCVLAANAPDIDILVLVFKGRWAFLQDHRGITHSIVGAAALALALPLIFYLGDRIIAQLRKQPSRVKLKGLFLASILTTVTHPFLDWTNNYGIRFLLPWNPKWSYGDFAFVVDPFFWMILGGAAFLLTSQTRRRAISWLLLAIVPSYLVLGDASAPDRPQLLLRILWIVALLVLVTLYKLNFRERAGAKIAKAALATVAVYCVVLFGAHALALRQARLQANLIANSNSEQILDLAAMPTVANPTKWLCVMETNRATYKFNLLLLDARPGSSNIARFEKPGGTAAAAVALAERDERAQVFMGFARFPAFKLVGEDCATQTLVQFADLRYTEPGTEPGKARGTFSLDVPIECPDLHNPSK
jgi:inner membrane protein